MCRRATLRCLREMLELFWLKVSTLEVCLFCLDCLFFGIRMNDAAALALAQEWWRFNTLCGPPLSPEFWVVSKNEEEEEEDRFEEEGGV